MAVCIDLASLDVERQNRIESTLFFTPMKKTPKGGSVPSGPPVNMYLVDNGKVRVPYLFGCALLQSRPNNDFSRMTPMECSISLRDYQVDVAEEALSHLRTKRTTTLSLYTGFGKTVLGTWLAHTLKLKTMIIAHREILIKQWESTITTAMPSAVVWVVGDRYPEQEPDYILCMSTRSHLLPELPMVGTMMIDEAHLLCSKSRVPALLSCTPKYVIAITATPYREDGMYKMITTMVGKHTIYRSNPNVYRVFEVNVPVMVEEEKGPKGLNYMKLCSDLSVDPDYNDFIVQVVTDNPGRKFIILTRFVAHTSELERLLQEKDVECSILTGSKKEYAAENKVLIGTMGTIGVGFDEVSFGGTPSDVMIFTHSVKQEGHFQQYRGRIRNPKCDIVWMSPKNRIFHRHLHGLKPYILGSNGQVIETTHKGIPNLLK